MPPNFKTLLSISHKWFSWFRYQQILVDVDIQNTDPHIHLNYLKIPVNPPYLKSPETPVNEFGLPVKKYYTTQDLCKVLNIKPDTLRYRLRKGYCREPVRIVGGKRRFTERDIREIIRITKELNNKGVLYTGKKS